MQQYSGGGEEAWRRNQFLEANKPTAQSSAGRDNITKEIGTGDTDSYEYDHNNIIIQRQNHY